MRDIFSPIFLASLLVLPLSHLCKLPFQAVQPFLGLTFILSLTLFVLKKWRASYVFMVLAMALMVAVIFLKGKANYLESTTYAVPQDQYITVTGWLTDFPEVRQDDSIVYLRTLSLAYEKKNIAKTLNLRIRVRGSLRHLARGDLIRINAKLSELRFNQNFFPNPIRNYYRYRNIHFNGYCKSASMVSRLQRSNVFWRLIGDWRNRIRRAIEAKYGGPDGHLHRKGVFLEAILLGDRGHMTADQKEELLRAGVFHLFAISGAHIGIIAIFSLLLLRWLKVPYKSRYIVTGLILVVFLILSGFKVSAQRAVLMALLIFAARILYDDIHIFNIISFSGFIMLVVNPTEFLNPGFILTYSLTAAIVWGRHLFLNLLSPLPNYFRELLSANISASLAALPLSLFFFKRYSFAGFLSGLVLLPLTAVITGPAILLIPLAPFWGPLARILLVVLDLPLRLFFGVVDLFAQSIKLDIYRASPPIYLVIFILTLFALMARSRISRLLRASLAVIFVGALAWGIFFVSPYRPDHLEAFFLDVGQGDSQCVVFPTGEGLLIDGGGTYISNFEVGRNLVLPFLLQQGIKIKWVAVTHYHPDHVKGIIEIVNIVKPQELWLFSRADGDIYYQQLIRELDPTVNLKKITAGFRQQIGGSRIECLFPAAFIRTDRSHNNHSGVLKISGPHHSFLFTGDIEWEVENRLVGQQCPALNADVLKVPHHGSKSSSAIDFLNCVTPGLAIFSYSRHNRFHFPHPLVKARYRMQNIRTMATAIHGGIKVTSTPEGLKIETSK
jgi:competence protein ComEC